MADRNCQNAANFLQIATKIKSLSKPDTEINRYNIFASNSGRRAVAPWFFLPKLFVSNLVQVSNYPKNGKARRDLPNVFVSLVDSDQRSSIFPDEVDRQQKEQSQEKH